MDCAPVLSAQINAGFRKTNYQFNKKLYFPPSHFQADVTTHYAMWWKQSLLIQVDFVKNIVKRKTSESSRKHRPRVGKTNRGSNDVGVPPGFPPNI